MRVAMVVARMMTSAVGGVLSVSLATKARRIAVGLMAVVALIIGVHATAANNTAIAKSEKQIHQQDARQAAQFAKAKVPEDAPTCTTSVKSGTTSHTVRVNPKGKVSSSTTNRSGTVTKTCK